MLGNALFLPAFTPCESIGASGCSRWARADPGTSFPEVHEVLGELQPAHAKVSQ